MMNLYNKRFSIVLALLILNFININLIIGHFTDKSGNYLSKDYYSKKICKKRWCKKCNKSKGYQGPIKADNKLERTPPRTAVRPNLLNNSLFAGAKEPIAPICIAIQEKFEKPHKA